MPSYCIDLPRIHVLGPVELICSDGSVAALPLQRRKIAALLAISLNTPLSTAKLAERLWREDLPSRSGQIVRTHLSILRKYLGPNALRKELLGHWIDTDACELDAEQFRSLVRKGRQLWSIGDYASAALAVETGLSLWREREAMPDERSVFDLCSEAVLLEEMRFQAQELLVACRFASRRSAQVLPLLKEMVAYHPERESPWIHLMAAEAMCGRVREALEVTYPLAYRHLVEQTGLDNPRLQAVQAAIIRALPSDALLTIVLESNHSTT